MTSGLEISHIGATAVVRLDRPERGNSFTAEMRLAMAELWPQLRDDARVRAVVFTGSGSRHFCTGTDVSAVAAGGRRAVDNSSARGAVDFTWRAHEFWKPVICAVNGACAGAGLHFVADADIVVAERQASFLDTHVNVGAVGALENIGLLRRLPLGTVLRMTTQGKSFRLDASRATTLGLVDELVEENESVDVALSIAADIARNSPSAIARSLRSIWMSYELANSASLDFGWSQVQAQWSHPDYAEGAKAFVERRQPQWFADTNASDFA